MTIHLDEEDMCTEKIQSTWEVSTELWRGDTDTGGVLDAALAVLPGSGKLWQSTLLLSMMVVFLMFSTYKVKELWTVTKSKTWRFAVQRLLGFLILQP